MHEGRFPFFAGDINTVGLQSAWGVLPGVVKSFPPFLAPRWWARRETTGKRDLFMAVLRREYKFAEDYSCPPLLATKNGIANGIDARDTA